MTPGYVPPTPDPDPVPVSDVPPPPEPAPMVVEEPPAASVPVEESVPEPLPPQSFELVVEPMDEDRSRFVSPIVRRLAREHAIDLAEVEGSGEAGRVTRRDVEAFMSGEPSGSRTRNTGA